MRASAVLAVALAAVATTWAAERCCDGAAVTAHAQTHVRARRSFSAWGGKRADAEAAGANDGYGGGDDDDEKRAFSSWGGKRAGDDKRPKQAFYSWGGKRAPDAEPDAEADEKRAGVRFSSWGGKRDPLMFDEPGAEELADGKRAFSSWGGKRFAGEAEAKRAFSSWGESLANRRLDLYNYRPVQLRNGHGPPFFPWGG